ncbi:Serine/threonine-protein phosphatase 1 [Rubripirellula obstinata]|uniref:Serine/threonine-protein phosphatase 1 n=1 Tax=Rubripirellula obstinata TaxID=406547 RepID=A0A5B1CF47_9BACT|nr:metallophosphoesterase family protein [Rubripirellula obstinata]KAA1258093.1 Serine/threonine-protein phosphatase 1 [Rubripirellula obstinata]
MPRHLAIGDIHGCLDALQTLVEFVGLRDDDDVLVTLGDYIDRGPDSRGVLDWLLEFNKAGRLVSLKGNHEVMLMEGRRIESERHRWFKFGGRETLESYAEDEDDVAGLEDIPLTHWEFLFDKLVSTYETETHIFVHASLDPSLPIAEQSDYLLHWGGYSDNFPRHVSGKTMVCGHKIQSTGRPATNGNAICIDTGAYKPDGWLTCLDPATGEIWQANQSGETRRMMLSEL